MKSFRYTLPALFLSTLTVFAEKPEEKKVLEPPSAFTLNCAACHMLDQVQVGPSLVEIAEIYPESKRKEFIEWCYKPGKKRPQMPAMPAMAHVPKEDLNEIYDYIRKVTPGVIRIPRPKNDPYPETKRPRIVRSFFPNTGPASIAVALPTEKLHNIIWDTDKCQLRYISEGEIDNWPYLKSNGAALAKVGKTVYTEKTQLFAPSSVQFLGYDLNKAGYPTFHYSVGGKAVSETIGIESGVITREIKGSRPRFTPVNTRGKTLETKTEQTENSITITHTLLK